MFKVDNILMINDDNDMGGAQRWENHIGREDIISEQPLSTYLIIFGGSTESPLKMHQKRDLKITFPEINVLVFSSYSWILDTI